MAGAMVYLEPEKTTHGKKSKTKLLLDVSLAGWWTKSYAYLHGDIDTGGR